MYKTMLELSEVSMLACELFNNDIEATKKWMKTPNDLLFGSTPMDICLSGESKYLINWLKDRLGLKREDDETI